MKYSRYLWDDEGEERPLVGAALSNRHKTCFVNAILQCLTHTVPLVAELLNSPFCSSCPRRQWEFCPLGALKQHIKFCLSKPGMLVTPFGFLNNLSKISSDFILGEQQDAHEFLQCLLNRVDNCCVGNTSVNGSPSLERDSLIKQVFGGRLRSQLQCCDCGHKSDTYEPLLDLSLDIDDNDVSNLHDALRSFTKVEEIDPEIKFSCEGCKAKVSMKKQLTLDKVPQVVAFHLKRFKIEDDSVHKIEKSVLFPTELNLQPFGSFPEEEELLNYELYAAVVHIGALPNEGHYLCIIRTSSDTWLCMNDERVFEFNNFEVLSERAYILFYIKQGSAPTLSSLMKSHFRPLCLLPASENYPVNPKSAAGGSSQNNPNVNSEKREDHTSNHDASSQSNTEESGDSDSSPHRPCNQNGILNSVDNEASSNSSQRRSCRKFRSEQDDVRDSAKEPYEDTEEKHEAPESSVNEVMNEVSRRLEHPLKKERVQ